MAEEQRGLQGAMPDSDLGVSWAQEPGQADKHPQAGYSPFGAAQPVDPAWPFDTVGYPSPGRPLPPDRPARAADFAVGSPAALPGEVPGGPPPQERAQPSSRRDVRAANRAPVEGGPLELGLDLATVRRGLWVAMVAIVVLDLLGSVGEAVGLPYLITRFFDGDNKVNFPTGYKTSFLLAVTLLFALLWRVARRDGDRFVPGWLLLTFVAAFAWMDETVYLHQSLSDFLHRTLHTGGVLTFAWTIVYVPAAAAVGVILLRYLRFLQASVRWPLMFGGGLYGGGAVLLEPVKSYVSDGVGESSLAFKLAAWFSDSCEMIGLTVLVVVLLSELARRARAVAVLFSNVPEPNVPAGPTPAAGVDRAPGGPFPGEPFGAGSFADGLSAPGPDRSPLDHPLDHPPDSR